LLVKQKSSREMAAAIDRLRSDPELREKLRREGRLRVEKSFSAEAVGLEMAKIIRELVETAS
jgi:glycosyltransferase involved in cell wall biosynthesis